MTETTIRALADAGAPAVEAPPFLAARVIAAHRRWRRRSGAAALTGLLLVGGTVAARTVGHSRYVAVYMPSGSMGTTVAIGESLVADRRLTPTYGDVVAMAHTFDGVRGQTIRRVIGLPGDTVSCPAGADGRCHAWTRNGQALVEPYAQGADGGVVRASTVGAGDVYVLGDQRELAVDSRLWPRPARLRDVLAVGVAVKATNGRLRVIPGAPRHPGPGSSNIDPAVQPPAVSVPLVTVPDHG